MGYIEFLDKNQKQYYSTSSPDIFGDYQFVSLNDIIDNFLVGYVGDGKIITTVSRSDVQFHAMRNIQELSYDTFKSTKSQEIVVPNTLTMILPQDYVNYVKLTWLSSKDGLEYMMYPTRKTSNPLDITQDANGDYTFSGNDLATDNSSSTWEDHKGAEFEDPETDQAVYPTYYIDHLTGKIHFSSNLTGKTIILKYISDGLGSEDEMIVHKFAEEAMYKAIACDILSIKSNIPEYIINRYKKEKFAARRTAKLRLSNLKIDELIQTMRGKDKTLKG